MITLKERLALANAIFGGQGGQSITKVIMPSEDVDPDEPTDMTTAVLGTAVLGTMVLGEE